MARHDVAGQLSRVPLFSGCSKRDLQTIARVVKDIDHRSGTVIAETPLAGSNFRVMGAAYP